jgi:hypothetical protein
MNRKDFGQLDASLRGEPGWSQRQLPLGADLDAAPISIIERRARRHFAHVQRLSPSPDKPME